MFEPEKKKHSLVIIGFFIIIVLAIAVMLLGRNKKTVTDNPDILSAPASESLVPQNAKSPEDFLEKVEKKSAAIQKNYDSNLTDFAKKRWEKLFRKQNGGNLDPEKLKILSPEIQKTADGSTLFKIKFRIKHGDTETEAEDFYYLILSEEKKVELGLNNLKANVFLKEEDVIKNLEQENFAKIEKIK